MQLLEGKPEPIKQERCSLPEFLNSTNTTQDLERQLFLSMPAIGALLLGSERHFLDVR